MTIRIPNSPVLGVGVVVGILIGAAEWISGGGIGMTLLSGAIPIAYSAAVTWVGRRNDAVGLLAGRPVDERWEHINLEATAWTLGVTAIVVLAAFIVTYASAGPWQPYAFMATVIGAAYFGSIVIVQRLH
jgi:hypothetical protein